MEINMTEECMRFACTQMARGLSRVDTARLIADSDEWEEVRDELAPDDAYQQILRQIRFADKRGTEFRKTKYDSLWEREKTAIEKATQLAAKASVDRLIARLENTVNRNDALSQQLEEKLGVWLNSNAVPTEVGTAMQLIATMLKVDRDSTDAAVATAKVLQELADNEQKDEMEMLAG